jgi:hypothetical protein
MRLSMIVLVGITVALLSSAPAAADVRIGHDAGGQIGPYLERLVALRNSGERVIIDGPCLSACTMVLGVIPRERICMTGRARLGFHAAWHPAGNGQQVASYGGTQLLMQVYPHKVRSWISRKGGLSGRMMYLQGRELAQMYPTC